VPKATSLKTLVETLVEETGFGSVLPAVTQVAASLTLADGYGAGPFSTQRFGRGAPIFLTSPADGGYATASTTTTVTDSTKAWTASEWIGLVVRMGGKKATVTANTATALTFTAIDAAMTVGYYTIEMPSTYLDTYTPSTGVMTVDPDFTGAFNAAQVKVRSAVVLNKDSGIEHMDVVRDAINRALEKRCWRKEMRPLTYVPDGDLQGEAVADYWTASGNTTAAYVSAQTYPAGAAADAVGQVGLSRVLQATLGASGSATVISNGIRVRRSTQQQSWYFRTAIRLVSGSGGAGFEIHDATNSVAIALQVTRGSDTNTLLTTGLGDFMVCEGTFQVPATCSEINVRLTLNASDSVAEMAPVILYPQNAVSFPLPNRIRNVEEVGNFYYGWSRGHGLHEMTFDGPITIGGNSSIFADYGDHLTVTFDFLNASQPVYFEELVYAKPLLSMTDTTTYDAVDVLRWAKYELYKRLYDRDPKMKAKTIEAKRAADRSTRQSVIQLQGRR